MNDYFVSFLALQSLSVLYIRFFVCEQDGNMEHYLCNFECNFPFLFVD